ncbi:uncharacterized protein EAE97_002213 [Botrytis byssoidea]|uniref:NADH dehydrogenase [ubiquinone] 1 beta subcomplex subunit 11, mitochondrial n=1 Tax=Botrytis byssoidea TaxID=139641 RepID=A0A9P5M7E0_9HELO|nr:uncharacterized protein EAE97_002213 [Botrytis byssoidea]KAF7950661.1 hypothetical protein EAE97_002213 [Botrytis byssoidea]
MSAPNELVWLGKLFLFRLNNKIVDTYASCKKKILEKVNNKKVKKDDVVEEVEVQEPTRIIHQPAERKFSVLAKYYRSSLTTSSSPPSHQQLHQHSLFFSQIVTSQSVCPIIASLSKMSFTRAIPRATSTIARTQSAVLNQARNLSITAARKSADHGDHYEPPSGWLFGVKPGEKAEKEGWENLWVYGFFGTCAFGIVGYAVKPDTSIQTWALEEARRRLEAEGILKEPEDKS